MSFEKRLNELSETKEIANKSDAYLNIDKRISVNDVKSSQPKDIDIDRRKDINAIGTEDKHQESQTVEKTSDTNKELREKEPTEEAVPKVVENKKQGVEREELFQKELEEKYPPDKGFIVKREAELRDKNGKIVVDPETNTYRRLDFVAVNKESHEVVGSYEVTSKTADKKSQTAKEERILNAGGRYVKIDNKLYRFPPNLKTEIVRKD